MTGNRAEVTIAKYRCDAGTIADVTRVTMRLPGITAPLGIRPPGGTDLSYCRGYDGLRAREVNNAELSPVYVE